MAHLPLLPVKQLEGSGVRAGTFAYRMWFSVATKDARIKERDTAATGDEDGGRT